MGVKGRFPNFENKVDPLYAHAKIGHQNFL